MNSFTIWKWREKRDIVLKTMQLPGHMSIEHSEEIKQSGNKIKNKHIFNKQVHNELFTTTTLGWIIKNFGDCYY